MYLGRNLYNNKKIVDRHQDYNGRAGSIILTNRWVNTNVHKEVHMSLEIIYENWTRVW